jgi:hypothetical protein
MSTGDADFTQQGIITKWRYQWPFSSSSPRDAVLSSEFSRVMNVSQGPTAPSKQDPQQHAVAQAN